MVVVLVSPPKLLSLGRLSLLGLPLGLAGLVPLEPLSGGLLLLGGGLPQTLAGLLGPLGLDPVGLVLGEATQPGQLVDLDVTERVDGGAVMVLIKDVLAVDHVGVVALNVVAVAHVAVQEGDCVLWGVLGLGHRDERPLHRLGDSVAVLRHVGLNLTGHHRDDGGVVDGVPHVLGLEVGRQRLGVHSQELEQGPGLALEAEVGENLGGLAEGRQVVVAVHRGGELGTLRQHP
eukprot:202227_1